MRPLLAHLVANDGWLPAEAARAHTDRYAQYLLHCDPLERFSVVSFVWGPGQRTPIHDHTVWGLIGMLRGAETAQHYRMAGDNPMVPVGELTRLQPGDVELVSPLTGDIHQVSNAYDDRTSISVHVYGANIGAVARHIFDPLDGTAKPMVSGYTSMMVPNLWDRSASVRRRAEEEAP
jgi:predicted metal-dependent enzyme (double-stranded beta helix superfamily)